MEHSKLVGLNNGQDFPDPELPDLAPSNAAQAERSEGVPRLGLVLLENIACFCEKLQQHFGNNGFGVSFKLPTGGSSLNITQMFEVSIGGTVYASYQHANKTSTLDKSKDYSISKNGYGGVFLFSTLSSSYYDGMDGVYI